MIASLLVQAAITLTLAFAPPTYDAAACREAPPVTQGIAWQVPAPAPLWDAIGQGADLEDAEGYPLGEASLGSWGYSASWWTAQRAMRVAPLWFCDGTDAELERITGWPVSQ